MEDAFEEAIKDEVKDIIVACLKNIHQELSNPQTAEGGKVLSKQDKICTLTGKAGGAKTERQMVEAKGTAQNETANLLSRDLKEEVVASIGMPRDSEGRIIYYDKPGNYFYVYTADAGRYEATRVDVYMELRTNPSGCTVDFPSGMIPVLITVIAAALKAR
jgi:hypothetical protein